MASTELNPQSARYSADRPRRTSFSSRAVGPSTLISASLSLLVTGVFATLTPTGLHWYLLPVAACGVLIGTDAVNVIRGRLSAFDPVGLLGLVGYHFFFVAPLLHVYFHHWLLYVEPPPDWRDWLGWMAVVNLSGLALYRVARSVLLTPIRPLGSWVLGRTRFLACLAVGLAAAAGMQAWVYQQTGGILGLISTYTEGDLGNASRGFGWIYMISESFPILALFGVVTFFERRKVQPSWILLAILLLLFLGTRLLFGGLRGSRSNTIWAMFWAAGVVHYKLRTLPRRALVLGALFVVGFMYAYGFYKAFGSEALVAAQSPRARAEMSETSGRSLATALLGDLARSDVQAFLLYRTLRAGSDVHFALGRTYAAAAALLIPSALWPDRPAGKEKEGTDAQYGQGSYRGPGTASSRVYGLAGEAILNFGLLGALTSFLVLGLAVASSRSLIASWSWGDPRIFLAPFLANWCLVLLVGDSDNVLFFGIKNGLVPFLILFFSSRRTRLSTKTRTAAR